VSRYSAPLHVSGNLPAAIPRARSVQATTPFRFVWARGERQHMHGARAVPRSRLCRSASASSTTQELCCSPARTRAQPFFFDGTRTQSYPPVVLSPPHPPSRHTRAAVESSRVAIVRVRCRQRVARCVPVCRGCEATCTHWSLG
jgi:hypothetical protein